MWLVFFAKNLNYTYERLKTSSYNAITHPMTITPLFSSGMLYATGYDEDITNHIIEKRYLDLSSNEDNLLRDINQYIVYATILTTNENYEIKAKRAVASWSSIRLSNTSTTLLNTYIKKETPLGGDYWAIGSNHGTEPFAAGIMTYKHLENSNLNNFYKYGIVGLNYSIASVISLGRVEDGGHSVGDQFVNAAVGNFLGVFIHDFFMLNKNLQISIGLPTDISYLNFQYSF